MQTSTSFGICAVRYSDEYIAAVRAIPDLENADAPVIELTRQALMDAMRAGTTFIALHKRANGAWVHWDAVVLITVAETVYVKLVDDRCALDDLGDLPEY
jgi:hypothetical protein